MKIFSNIIFKGAKIKIFRNSRLSLGSIATIITMMIINVVVEVETLQNPLHLDNFHGLITGVEVFVGSRQRVFFYYSRSPFSPPPPPPPLQHFYLSPTLWDIKKKNLFFVGRPQIFGLIQNFIILSLFTFPRRNPVLILYYSLNFEHFTEQIILFEDVLLVQQTYN